MRKLERKTKMSEKVTSIAPRLEAKQKKEIAKKTAASVLLMGAIALGTPKAVEAVSHLGPEQQEISAMYIKASGVEWRNMRVTFGPDTPIQKDGKVSAIGKDELLSITNFIVFDGPDGQSLVATQLDANSDTKATNVEQFAEMATIIPFNQRLGLEAVGEKDPSERNPVLSIDGLSGDADQVERMFLE
jgi:hypothetical protein